MFAKKTEKQNCKKKKVNVFELAEKVHEINGNTLMMQSEQQGEHYSKKH